MKYLVLVFGLFVVVADANAATGRLSTASQMADPSRVGLTKTPMVVTSVQPGSSVQPSAVADKASVHVEPIGGNKNDVTAPAPAPSKDMREKEKAACVNNNIGIGNTFVWASRYSNTGNYAAMVEDTENPENNTCFVKVELKSDDAKVNVSDIPSKYFVMGQTITCGSWIDEDALEKRILDAKKSARTWATVGGVVGGAGVGVGAMELFGNKLIGGAVQGQKADNLSQTELLYSQMMVLQKNGDSRLGELQKHLKDLKSSCEDPVWSTRSDKPKECTDIDYNRLLSI